MKATDKALAQRAKALGITTDELLEELSVATPEQGFTVAINFERLADLKEFAKSLAGLGVGIYSADSLDPEYKGVVSKNNFVIRSLNSTSGKPETWRVA